MQRIAFLTNSTWNLINFRQDLILKLMQSGYGVYCIAPKDQYSDAIQSICTEFIELNSLERKGKNILKELLLIHEIRSVLKAKSIDLLLNFTIKANIYGSLASKGLKTKPISNITGLGSVLLSPGFLFYSILQLYKVALKNNTSVVFQNQSDIDFFINRRLLPSKKVLHIQGSGIDSSFYSPSINESGNCFTYIFVGRLLLDKGIIEYLKACSFVLNNTTATVEFLIVGDFDSGNPSSISESALQKYLVNTNIKYVGHTKDVRSLLAKSDVLVLPSYREGLSRSILEAMSMSKPIITTNVPGCKDLVSHMESGLLVEPKDYVSLGKAMLKVLNMSKEILVKWGSINREKVRTIYDIEIINKKYCDLIATSLKTQTTW